MQASVLDLRYHMKKILQALERHETVEILYHGKPRGTIVPTSMPTHLSTQNHPYFGMGDTKKTISKQMEELRDGRYNAI